MFVEELARYLVGRDPFRIKEFMILAGKFAEGRGSVDVYAAMSGRLCGTLWARP